MFKFNIFLFVLFVFFSSPTWGQDVQFSQSEFVGSYLNSSITSFSKEKGGMFSSVYRNQGMALKAEAYETFSTTYLQRFKVGKFDYLTGGVYFLSDKAGALDFQNKLAKIAISYLRKISGGKYNTSYLSAGFDFGFNQYKIDFGDARWAHQHDGNGRFNPNLFSHLENYGRTEIGNLDIGAGLTFITTNATTNSGFRVGISMSHLNKPNTSFNSEGLTFLQRRVTFHAHANFPFSQYLRNKVHFFPKFIFHQQGASKQIMTGFDVGYKFENNEDMMLRIGANLRLVQRNNQSVFADGVIISLKFDTGNVTVSISEDFTVSKLRKVNNAFGATEVGLTFIFNQKGERKIYCKF